MNTLWECYWVIILLTWLLGKFEASLIFFSFIVFKFFCLAFRNFLKKFLHFRDTTCKVTYRLVLYFFYSITRFSFFLRFFLSFFLGGGNGEVYFLLIDSTIYVFVWRFKFCYWIFSFDKLVLKETPVSLCPASSLADAFLIFIKSHSVL